MSDREDTEYPPKRVLDYRQYIRQVDFRENISNYVGWVFIILATALPLWFVYLSVDAIAGKETTFDVKIGAAFGFYCWRLGIYRIDSLVQKPKSETRIETTTYKMY